jgi:hypothetical protein
MHIQRGAVAGTTYIYIYIYIYMYTHTHTHHSSEG